MHQVFQQKNYKDNDTLACQRAIALKDVFFNYVFQCGFKEEQFEIVSLKSIVQNNEQDIFKA